MTPGQCPNPSQCFRGLPACPPALACCALRNCALAGCAQAPGAPPGPCTFRPLGPPGTRSPGPHPPAEAGFTFRCRRSLGFAGSAARASALGRRPVKVFGAKQTSEGGRGARNRAPPGGPSRLASPLPSDFDVIAPLRPPPSPGKRRARSSSGTAEVVRDALAAGEPPGDAAGALPRCPPALRIPGIIVSCAIPGAHSRAAGSEPRGWGLDTVELRGTAKCCIKSENPGATQFLRVAGATEPWPPRPVTNLAIHPLRGFFLSVSGFPLPHSGPWGQLHRKHLHAKPCLTLSLRESKLRHAHHMNPPRENQLDLAICPIKKSKLFHFKGTGRWAVQPWGSKKVQL